MAEFAVTDMGINEAVVAVAEDNVGTEADDMVVGIAAEYKAVAFAVAVVGTAVGEGAVAGNDIPKSDCMLGSAEYVQAVHYFASDTEIVLEDERKLAGMQTQISAATH